MQRREFIGSVLWTTLFARIGFAQGLEKTLLALARVVIPDRDPAVWNSGEVALAMTQVIESLSGSRKDQVAATLTFLNDASKSQMEEDFCRLSLQDRTRLVKEAVESSEEVNKGFETVRAAALRCFYSSSVGRQRTGYRQTNQFEGYPEHVRAAEIWE